MYWQRGRLLVFPGGKGGGLELLPTDTDGTTVRELGLDADQAGVLEALRSAPLTMPLTYTSATPQIAVTIGTIGPRTVTLTSATSLKFVAASLMIGLELADASPGFRGAQVLVANDRLLVLPGPVGAEIAEYLRIDLALDDELDLDRETAFLLGNVVAASHGETVRAEVLGDGDAAARVPALRAEEEPADLRPVRQARRRRVDARALRRRRALGRGARPLRRALDRRGLRDPHRRRRDDHDPARRRDDRRHGSDRAARTSPPPTASAPVSRAGSARRSSRPRSTGRPA